MMEANMLKKQLESGKLGAATGAGCKCIVGR
jgi:hypothetical protein